jgi:ribonuclease-3
MPEIEERLHYHFNNKELLLLAFTHRSFWNEHKDSLKGHNERLEFLGDSVLGFIVAEYLYKKFEDLPEGVLSDLRAQLVKADMCAQFFLQLALEPYILLGKGEQMNEGKGRQTIIANLFEALMGAIYLDGGLKAAETFFFSHFQHLVDESVQKPESNWKAELQDYIQKKYHQIPIYEILEESGPSHSKKFVVAVIVNGKEIAKGEGSSKKRAQIDGAKHALQHYKNNPHYS